MLLDYARSDSKIIKTINKKLEIAMNNHEIDYKLFGEEMQCVEIELDPQEAVLPVKFQAKI